MEQQRPPRNKFAAFDEGHAFDYRSTTHQNPFSSFYQPNYRHRRIGSEMSEEEEEDDRLSEERNEIEEEIDVLSSSKDEDDFNMVYWEHRRERKAYPYGNPHRRNLIFICFPNARQ